MRNEHRDCDQLSAAAAAAAAVGTPGCGTFTAQTRVGNAARAIKMLLFPPYYAPPPTAAGACMTFPKQLG